MIALKAFDRAIELDPKHVDAYVARGAVLAKNTDSEKMTVSRRVECLEEARRDFKLALELEEGNEDAKKYRRKSRRKAGVAKATNIISRVVAAMPATRSYITALEPVVMRKWRVTESARLEQREKNKDRIEKQRYQYCNGSAQKNALEEDKEMIT